VAYWPWKCIFLSPQNRGICSVQVLENCFNVCTDPGLISQFNAGSWVVAVGRSASPPPHRAICCYGRASLNCQPVTYMPALPSLTRRLHGGSVCVLMSSIRISQVVVFTRYRRRSLSYDIVAMCGWRLISRYRFIDIIPTPLLAAYLHRIGRQDSATCPHCNGADETAEHLVLHCPAHDQARRE